LACISFFLVFGYFEDEAGISAMYYGLFSTTIFMLFQEALFLCFVYLERMYLPYLKSGTFYLLLFLINGLVIGALSLDLYCRGSSANISLLLISGYGLVGGNLGCAFSLGLAFRLCGLMRSHGVKLAGRN